MIKSKQLLLMASGPIVLPMFVWAQAVSTTVDRASSDRVEVNSGYTIKEQELEERRARLLAQESKLLEELRAEGRPTREVTGEPSVESDPSAAVAANQSSNDDEFVPFALQGTSLPSSASASVGEQQPLQATGTDAGTKKGSTDLITSVADAKDQKVAELRRISTGLESQVQSLKVRNQALGKELQEARDRLMIAETEVERLSRLLREKNSATLAHFGAAPLPPTRQAPAAVPQRPQTAPQVNVVKSAPRAVEDEPLIATVMVDKANLRTGPSKDDAPAMTVSRGTRLVVEKRVGAWYRVITPAGTRAWVATEVVAFGETNQSSPSRTVKIRGYDPSLEDETLKTLNNRSR